MSSAATRRHWFWICLGLGFATASTLALEIAITRIFSVILWYHFGFMAISLALLGLGLAGIVVYLYPERFPRESAALVSAKAAILFAATTLGALLLFHWIVSVRAHWPLGSGYRAMIFLVTAVPFFFGGLCVAIPISRYVDRVGVLYSADLIGAALGAVMVIPLISLLDGHPVVIVCAACACASAVCFATGARNRRTQLLGLCGLVGCLVAASLATATDFFRIRYAKNMDETSAIAQRWNSFSRVAVYQPKRDPALSFGWNLGKGAPRKPGSHLWIKIDSDARTPMIAFDGDLGAVEFLGYDISSLGYQIRPSQNALIIGAGGGRDILTAKLFHVDSIHAVEVNPIVVDFVRMDFREFGGNPYELPGVSWSVLDGRSYVAQSRELFDHVQLPAVDTSAALAAGALSLVENSLYTVEAFEDYHDRLSEDGVLSVTRNWTVAAPLMALRSADLVRTAWERRGHSQPDRHIIVVAPGPGTGKRWGTLLASRRPFEDHDLVRLGEVVDRLGFEILYQPDRPNNPEAFRALFGDDREGFLADYPYDVRATTDDKPFFFFFLKPFPFLQRESAFSGTQELFWASRVTPRILLQLFALVTGAVLVLAFLIPILLGRLELKAAAGTGRSLLYFAAIGLGFIMIELPLIQRYTLVIGKPLYAFAGILACVLVFGGIGSFVSHSVRDERLLSMTRLALSAVILGALLHVVLIPSLLRTVIGLELPMRLLITGVTIAPLGFVMGMPLPLGMRLMQRRAPRALAWAWGVNGSLSVMGSVLAMAVSVFFGITYALLAAVLMYAFAFAAYGKIREQPAR